MNYLSTRASRPSGTGSVPLTRFCEILLEGLAPDGGLYLPESYPQVSAQQLEAWRQLP
jgi:threonine synthase